MNISLTMDAASLAKIQQLADWQPGSHFYDAMSDCLNMIQDYAVDYMFSNFINPQGQLEGAFFQVITPGVNSIEGMLANPEAYAWRANSGFHGPDSLGRVYNYDGIQYMENSLDAKTSDILARFALGLQDSLSEIAGA